MPSEKWARIHARAAMMGKPHASIERLELAGRVGPDVAEFDAFTEVERYYLCAFLLSKSNRDEHARISERFKFAPSRFSGYSDELLKRITPQLCGGFMLEDLEDIERLIDGEDRRAAEATSNYLSS